MAGTYVTRTRVQSQASGSTRPPGASGSRLVVSESSMASRHDIYVGYDVPTKELQRAECAYHAVSNI